MKFFGAAVQDPLSVLVRGLETLCKQLQTATNFRPDPSNASALALVGACTERVTHVLNQGPTLSAPPSSDKQEASPESDLKDTLQGPRSFF